MSVVRAVNVEGKTVNLSCITAPNTTAPSSDVISVRTVAGTGTNTRKGNERHGFDEVWRGQIKLSYHEISAEHFSVLQLTTILPLL